jgi:hypothetical protein
LLAIFVTLSPTHKIYACNHSMSTVSCEGNGQERTVGNASLDCWPTGYGCSITLAKRPDTYHMKSRRTGFRIRPIACPLRHAQNVRTHACPVLEDPPCCVPCTTATLCRCLRCQHKHWSVVMHPIVRTHTYCVCALHSSLLASLITHMKQRPYSVPALTQTVQSW